MSMPIRSNINWNAPYQWPEGKKCGVLISFDVDGESPYLWQTRDVPSNKLAELEQRRFGPRIGVHRVLDLLEKWDIPATFFVPGQTAALYPELLSNILRSGFEIGLHGYQHERVDELSINENIDILERSLEIFKKQTGLETFGFRSPAWEMTSELFQILNQYQLLYDSSLMGSDHPYTIDGISEIPVQWLTDDAIYFRYTASTRDKGAPSNPKQVLDSWIEEFEGLRAYGGLFSLTAHPWISGRPQRIRLLDKLFAHIRQYDDVWWAPAIEFSQYHKTSENFDRYVVRTKDLVEDNT
jgi:peptidoglycan/xylan/chitin deacetylase (PgdA/CDA1 family)